MNVSLRLLPLGLVLAGLVFVAGNLATQPELVTHAAILGATVVAFGLQVAISWVLACRKSPSPEARRCPDCAVASVIGIALTIAGVALMTSTGHGFWDTAGALLALSGVLLTLGGQGLLTMLALCIALGPFCSAGQPHRDEWWLGTMLVIVAAGIWVLSFMLDFWSKPLPV